MKLLIGGLLFVLSILNSSPSFAQSAETHEIYIIAHGGYGSCGQSGDDAGYDPLDMSMSEIFNKSLKEIENSFANVEVKFIAACFGRSFDSPPGAISYYKQSGGIEELKSVESGDFHLVFDQEHISPETPIYLIGHSYGAWTVMNALINAGKNYNVKGLYTLDPIGPNDCSPWGAIWGSDGCFHAPTDLDFALVAEYTSEWINFFQDTDMWLQSSKIEEADANWHVPYEYGEGHRIIDADERVWQEVLNSILHIL